MTVKPPRSLRPFRVTAELRPRPTVLRCYAHWDGVAIPFKVTLTNDRHHYYTARTVQLASDMPQAALVPFGKPSRYLCRQEPVQLRASMARVNFPLPWRPTCMPITSTRETEGTTQVTVNQPGWVGSGTVSAMSSG